MAKEHETTEHPKAPTKAAAEPAVVEHDVESPDGGYYQQPQPGKARVVRERSTEDEAHDQAVAEQAELVTELEREQAEPK